MLVGRPEFHDELGEFPRLGQDHRGAEVPGGDLLQHDRVGKEVGAAAAELRRQRGQPEPVLGGRIDQLPGKRLGGIGPGIEFGGAGGDHFGG